MTETRSETFTEAELAARKAGVEEVMNAVPVRRCQTCRAGVEGVPPGMLWWCIQMHFNHRIELCEPCALACIERLVALNPSCDRGRFIALFHKEPAEPCLRFSEARRAHREANRWYPEVRSEEPS